MRRFRQHRDVRTELRGAARWFQARAGLGADLLDEFDAAIDAIVENPRAWPRWAAVPGNLEIRRYFLHRFPYHVPYLLDRADDVFVLAFAHTSRWPGYWLKRAPAR